MNLKDYRAEHFDWRVTDKAVGVVTLNRPERKNPLTFESYAELGAFFRQLNGAEDVDAVIIQGAGGNFCSGGDVHEIIGPLVERDMKGLMEFTRMTGELILAIRSCRQPVIAAIDGICVGAGACIAMASDLRFGTDRTKTAFLFVRVGLAGCDMGSCAILPRIIGQGRASELLFSGRIMGAEEGRECGWFNRLCEADTVFDEALTMATSLTAGPVFAHGMTKTMINQEWNMSLEQIIEAEAQAQAICMQTQDFSRAYHAFVKKSTPDFEGN